jgi:hypothetical protein
MRTITLSLLLLIIPAAAFAQPDPMGGEERTWDDVRSLADGLLRVRTRWDAARPGQPRTCTVRVERLAADGRTVAASRTVLQGPTVVPALAVSGDVALVAMVHEGAGAFVKLAFVDVPAAGGLTVRPVVTAPRPEAARTLPSWAVLASDPEGFGILWQESNMVDPNDAAHSFLGRLRRDGSWSVRPHEVAVPWPTAAMEWNGHGWTAALWFGGFGGAGGPDGIRVCLVTLSLEGQPEQHPWWVSRPERVGEVQMLRTAGGMEVVWRGGPEGTTLHSHRSEAVGNWGSDPAPARAHGAIAEDEPFALREGAGGRVEVVRVPPG